MITMKAFLFPPLPNKPHSHFVISPPPPPPFPPLPIETEYLSINYR